MLEILILGSMPSVMSLKKIYCGNPKNLFWKILFDVFNNGVPNDLILLVNKLPARRRIIINGKSKDNSASFYFDKYFGYFGKEEFFTIFDIINTVSTSSAYPIKYDLRLQY